MMTVAEALEISRVGTILPDLAELEFAAAVEGEHSMRRLVAEWQSGALRFDSPGEELLVARLYGRTIAVGGVTSEPSGDEAFRLRRFYVLPARRNRGIGRALATRLIEAPERSRLVLTVHAGNPQASRFWERLGFVPVDGLPYSHRRSPPPPPSRGSMRHRLAQIHHPHGEPVEPWAAGTKPRGSTGSP